MKVEERLGAGRGVELATFSEHDHPSLHLLTTHDGAIVSGVLHEVAGASVVAYLMHPRQDSTHHGLVDRLLSMGVAVWTQQTRSVNNDLNLVHEQALLDVAAGMSFLSDRFPSVVPIGHSGGGTLFAYYVEQASLEAPARITCTPAGRPVDLTGAQMPLPAGMIFLAPHPGQGRLLLTCIDPSVAVEGDPLSVDRALNPFEHSNGFSEPPGPSRYEDRFVARYREAQLARVARIDEVAREHVARQSDRRERYKRSGTSEDRRAALAPLVITTYRTDADLRCVDPSLDENERPYGSVFGRRPDLTNYGLIGFGRLATPEAWLSTWSGLTSKADFVRCAPAVRMPTLFIELTGDQAAFPSDSAAMVDALGAEDLTRASVRGTHFGGPIRPEEPAGFDLAAAEIAPWLAARFDEEVPA